MVALLCGAKSESHIYGTQLLLDTYEDIPVAKTKIPGQAILMELFSINL